MPKDARADHYESEFEFPLWTLIKAYAEEHDVSYIEACSIVTPEYEKGIRYRDIEFENEEIGRRRAEMQAQVEEEAAAARAKREKGGQ
jgi:hypothetical protein